MFSRTKSVGRFARSVEIITHRPTMGSFLSSGTPTSFPLDIAQTVYFTPQGRRFERLRPAGGNCDRHSIRSRYRSATGTTVASASDILAPLPQSRASYAGPPLPLQVSRLAKSASLLR